MYIIKKYLNKKYVLKKIVIKKNSRRDRLFIYISIKLSNFILEIEKKILKILSMMPDLP